MIIDGIFINDMLKELFSMGYNIYRDEGKILILQKDNIQINIVNNLIDHISEVNIRFCEKNKCYSIGWIYFIITGRSTDSKNKCNNIKILLKFIVDYYEELTDIQYCEDAIIKVRNYLSKKMN